VWKYDRSPGYTSRINVDIFARAQSSEDYSIIDEVGIFIVEKIKTTTK
jgi:hypothetical protein